MRMNPLITGFLLVALASTGQFAMAGGVKASDVMAAAKTGLPVIADALSEVNAGHAFVTRLAGDSGYAEKMLAALQKKDSTSVIALIQQTMPRLTIRIDKMDPDAYLFFHASASLFKHTINLCIDTRGSTGSCGYTIDIS